MKTAAHPFRPEHGALHVRRQIANYLTIGLTTLFAAAAIFFLGYLIYYVARQGIKFLNVDYFTQPPAAEGESGGGVYPAIIGSLSIVGVASAIGVPLGIFTGIYLSEFGRGRIAVLVAFMVNILTGLPGILFGLFAWILIVVPEKHFSGFSGSVALSIIMIPTVARATEEVLRLVPKELREGSVALGATESRTILRVVLPAATSGIITGILLAVARVAGETAPLLFTAFGNNFARIDFFGRAIDALPLRIYKQTLDPFAFVNDQAFAGAFVLLLMVLVTSFLVRWATGGFKQR
jgi:phosphate transport system permease protein